MQLDLGHLELHNNFEWHGGEKDVASAVHLDVLCAEVMDFQLSSYCSQIAMSLGGPQKLPCNL